MLKNKHYSLTYKKVCLLNLFTFPIVIKFTAGTQE